MTIQERYFEWLYDIACDELFAEENSYTKLFEYLHNRPFVWSTSLPKDENRSNDGKGLRYRFQVDFHYSKSDCAELYDREWCSCLEMIIGIALRCEETIMDDPSKGDRTKQWIWGMINSLGLGGMYDTRFNLREVDKIVTRWLHREYEPDGDGNIFRIRNCDYDLRTVEIWTQLLWYLDKYFMY